MLDEIWAAPELFFIAEIILVAEQENDLSTTATPMTRVSVFTKAPLNFIAAPPKLLL